MPPVNKHEEKDNVPVELLLIPKPPKLLPPTHIIEL
jgi:hypothetical protein